MTAGPRRESAASVAAEIMAEEAWFNALPRSARDDLGDHNFAVAQHLRGVRLARAVQSEADDA